MNRRYALGALAVSLLLVVAGCAGPGGGGDAQNGTDSDLTTGGEPVTTSDDTGVGGTDTTGDDTTGDDTETTDSTNDTNSTDTTNGTDTTN
ncbi:hypothetical protein [Halobacterium litoreum]|uniref:Uncharacterized protein n=1 Tax=Halobacterium litoreum TaxID=2039234 RepID=A0ABD5NCI4_9EURY|nr:hypothetical protein [Halobacterium litoreum]UHH14416.1 hypothetical protein LT972_05305 [Halobacterium litoreum]